MLLPGKLRYREVSATFNYNYIGRPLLPEALKKYPVISNRMLLMADDGGFTLEMQSSSR